MKPATKCKVAFFDFTGCEGCQLTVLDALQNGPELLDWVEIVQFREAMSEKGQDYEIAFVEGSCSQTADEERLKVIRANARIVVALGACAHLGGVNSMRNRRSLTEIQRIVYGQGGQQFAPHEALPVAAVIEVDYVIPGCPIDRWEFIRAVQALALGQPPQLPDQPLCSECKLRETVCLFTYGIPCLGPVTRAGCGALCPALGLGCEGCRGMVPAANVSWLYAAARSHGVGDSELDAAARLFLSHEMAQMEGGKHD